MKNMKEDIYEYLARNLSWIIVLTIFTFYYNYKENKLKNNINELKNQIEILEKK